MINEYNLIELLSKYGIDFDKIPEHNRERILSRGEYNSIVAVLDYLTKDLSISPSRIESCSSILYTDLSVIKENFDFLSVKGISASRINRCLYVLENKPDKLKDTYNYVVENYGSDFLDRKLSILNVDVEVIKKIEAIGKDKLSKKGILYVAINILWLHYYDLEDELNQLEAKFAVCDKYGIAYKDGGDFLKKNVNEIEDVVEACREVGLNYQDGGLVFCKKGSFLREIANVCLEYGINYKNGGVVFNSSVEQIKEVVEVCKKHGIDYRDGGSIFEKTAEEIESIVATCQKYGVKYKDGGMIFQKSPEDVCAIIEFCQNNGIDCSNGGVVFTRQVSELKELVAVCLEYGIKYKDSGQVFHRTAADVREIVEYCKEEGINYESVSMFIKSPSGIKEVVKACRKHGINYQKGGVIFKRQVQDIEELVDICKQYNIDYLNGGTVFGVNPGELRKIAELCLEAGIEPKGAILQSKAETIRESISYVRDNYGEDFVTRTVVRQKVDRLKQVLPYFEENGYLSGLLEGSAGVLTLSFDEILEREKVIKSLGQEVIVNGKFNSIFGQPRKTYSERYKTIIEEVRNNLKKSSVKR